MSTEIIQVRDVPGRDVEILRTRAAERNLSLSAYLRELIHEHASRPTMVEALDRIATRAPIEGDPADLRRFIDEQRR